MNVLDGIETIASMCAAPSTEKIVLQKEESDGSGIDEASECTTLVSHSIGTSDIPNGDNFSSTSSLSSSGLGALKSKELLKPIQPTSAANLQQKLVSMTVRKLRFDTATSRNKQQLYGRQDEMNLLSETLERVASSNHEATSDSRSVFVAIEGRAGVGKSILAQYVARSARKRKGALVIAGKFDNKQSSQQVVVEPYQAFSQAVRDMCEQILHEGSRKRCETLRQKIQQEMGREDMTLLFETFPPLRHLMMTEVETQEDNLQEQAPTLDLRVHKKPATAHVFEAQDKFRITFCRLFKIMCNYDQTMGPFVVILDDLQSADSASLELLVSLLHEPQTSRLMVVGTIRDDEMEASSELAGMLRNLEMRKSSKDFLRMSLCGLTIGAVHELLENILSESSDRSMQLAECIHRKTGGNPFFLLSFLTMLGERNLLSYNIGTMKWTWSVEEIVEKTSATENVIDIIQSKMQKLPREIRDLLPIMSCLVGSTFKGKVFSMLVSMEREYLANGDDASLLETTSYLDILQRCQQEYGLIEQCAEDEYSFVHDKIREAASLLCDSNALAQKKYRAARYLAARLTREELEETLFVVTDLYNARANELPEDSLERILVADMNLRSGKKSAKASAFSEAATFYANGIRLIPQNHWTSHTNLSVELYSGAAEACFCSADLGMADHFCQMILKQPHISLFQKQRAYNVRIELVAANDNMQEGADICLSLLGELGCHFPRRLLQVHVVVAVAKALQLMHKYSTDDILALPTLGDRKIIWAHRILDKLATFLYFLKSDLLAIVIVRRFLWTLKYGIGEDSPVVLVQLGIILAVHLNNFKKGKEFADCAMKMIEKHGVRNYAGRSQFIANSLVFHWSSPLESTLKGLLDGYEAGLLAGDTESALFSIFFYLDCSWRSGKPLDCVAENFKVYIQQMKDFQQQKILDYTYTMVHQVANLTGDWSLLDEDAPTLDALRVANQGHNRDTCDLVEQAMFFFSEDYESQIRLMHETKMPSGSFDESMQGTPTLAQLYFYNALGCFSRFYADSGDAVSCFKLGKRFTKKLKRWGDSGNPNVLHCVELLQGEIISCRLYQSRRQCHRFSRKSITSLERQAQEHYYEAVRICGRRGWIHHQALTHERLADHCIRQQQNDAALQRKQQRAASSSSNVTMNTMNRSDAAYHAALALRLYREWGARAKANLLRQRFEGLVSVDEMA